MVYWLLRALLRHALQVFFRRIEVDGLESVPHEGPLLLAPNHPNTLIDVLLVASSLRRQVGFVGKATLFEGPLLGWLLRSLGAVPIHRRQDGPVDAAAQQSNQQSLQACVDAVADGRAILIFPEGLSQQDAPRLMELKTGLARIALGAEERAPGAVVVVPVALVYDQPGTFRSRARVDFGAPIPAAPFRALGQQAGDPFVGVRALTEAVRQALLPDLVHVEEGHEELASELDLLYGEAISEQAGGRLAASAAISNALNHFARSQPERVAAVRARLAAYRAALADAGAKDPVVRRRPRRPGLLANLAFVLGAPLAGWGALNHFVLYQLPRLAVRLLPPDRTFTATIKLLTGLLGLAATYAVQGWLAHELARRAGLDPPWAPTLIYLGTLPLTGVVALFWLEAAWTRWQRARTAWARRRLDPARLAALQDQRQALLVELDRARADYLGEQLQPAPAEADEPW